MIADRIHSLFGGGASELDHIEFPFNPKEWSITHTAEWKTETTKKEVAPPEFRLSRFEPGARPGG